MDFAEVLNQYMEELNCTAKKLSQKTGISMAQISRYRNGLIIPKNKKESIEIFSDAFSQFAQESPSTYITKEKISRDLSESIEDDFDYELFQNNFNILVKELGISLTELASDNNYSISTISKMKLGSRRPRDPQYVVESIADYLIQKYPSKVDYRKIIELIGHKKEDFQTTQDYKKAIIDYLSGKEESSASMKGFMDFMDAFDFDEFLREKKIGSIRLPTVPLQLPINKNYEGIEGFEKGLMAFVKATVLSRSTRDVILYSDFPMERYVADDDFATKFAKGIATLLVKKLRVNIIHNIDRPFDELILGLKYWIPLHMTGLVSSFYIDETSNNFRHTLLVSSNASFVGGYIADYLESGRYTFSKANSDVVSVRIQAEELLSVAKPLVEIYKKDREEDFKEVIESLYSGGIVKGIYTVPPIYTISEKLLEKILNSNDVIGEGRERIYNYYKTSREKIIGFLEDGGFIDIDIPLYSRDESRKNPIVLSLGGMFSSKKIYYTYDDYLAHIEESKKFSDDHCNFIIETLQKECFRNIQINIHDDEMVIVSNISAPSIHYVSRNTRIVEACHEMAVILMDQE